MQLSELNERLSNQNMGRVYCMEELDEALSGIAPREVILKIEGGEFNSRDKYFEFDGYDNLTSYLNIEDVLEVYEDIE